MPRIRGWTFVCGMFLFCAAAATVSLAQVSFNTLVAFTGVNGSSPQMVLTQGMDGDLYGTTYDIIFGDECPTACGTVFKMTPTGTLTTLYRFCSVEKCKDGAGPLGSLVQTPNGDFYGTTQDGGSHRGGTVFKITPTGTLTTLYRFCARDNCVNGKWPTAGLTLASDGNFYGTAQNGGSNNCSDGCGTVFRITPAGELTAVYTFCQTDGCLDGYEPSGQLLESNDGNFYGEAQLGGPGGYGTIFKMTPAGHLTTLFGFNLANGSDPSGGLIRATNGDFYGVASGGGSQTVGCVFYCGTVFKMIPAGELTTLHYFCPSLLDCSDGAQPYGPLVQAPDGNFYGTTSGATINPGTIFQITPAGALTTLYSFCSQTDCADGFFSEAGLLQATSGTFYGTTAKGGIGGLGTAFSLSTGFGPFVKTQPSFANEGARVGIFGQGFTSSSVVQFGGVQATSVKLSGTTFLTAKVPAGALTGSVTVTTGTTTLVSNQPFRVKPQVVSFDPPSGSVGTQVTITGTGFTQTNGVGFGNNVPAEFTVNSDTQVTATVPTGAKTGPVGVVTKGGTAISEATFTVN
jgi:uncharacterized repeat protein (TIGR03803 family)